MVKPIDEIGPPLSDRTLKYGRNTGALSATIFVLWWIDEIDINEFEPFGLSFSADGQSVLWLILAIIVGYYAIQFMVNALTDFHQWSSAYKDPEFFPSWLLVWGIQPPDRWFNFWNIHLVDLSVYDVKGRKFKIVHRKAQREVGGDFNTVIHLKNLLIKMWLLEIGVPLMLLCAAVIALWNVLKD